MSMTQHLVLIVNNDEAIRDALRFSLQLKGLNVRAHRAGSELLLDPSLPSAACIISDDRMPEMDGFELLRQLAAQNRLRAYDPPDRSRNAETSGARSRRRRPVGAREALSGQCLGRQRYDDREP